MENLFVPYDIAIELKELGFDGHCLGRYIYDERNFEWYLVQTQQSKPASIDFMFDKNYPKYNYVSAPLYQQVLDWFREKHNINIIYIVGGSNTEVLGYKWFVQVGMENQCYETKMIKDYYVGMTEAIEKVLRLI